MVYDRFVNGFEKDSHFGTFELCREAGKNDVKLTWVRIKISRFDKNILTIAKASGIVHTKKQKKAYKKATTLTSGNRWFKSRRLL